ncbi:MAG: N-6 DNA methylase [Phycisphaerae bacterium]|nr:N-6 DNA methylase [Phycisphaerae bacterium]
MIASKEHISSNEIERKYSQLTSIEHRKKFAQFFTPYPIAELMTKWLLGNRELENVLEPAFGLGVFARALLNQKPDINITGFEIDRNIFEKAQSIFSDAEKIQLHPQDYMHNDWGNKYDGIICNPPYFKFHDYDNKRTLKEIEKRTSCKLNGFTNLYALFLLKSLSQLKRNGRIAYIVPSEFLNSDYGKQVKFYLIKSRFLRHIIIIDFEKNVFEDALTTASILLFANDDNQKGVYFTNITNLKNIGQIEKIIVEYPNVPGEGFVSFENLNPEIKWRVYYQPQNSIKYKHLVPFANYGKVVRGIATGANEYFTFNSSKAEKFNIDRKYLLPCISKAVNIKSSFFTEKDFEKLQNRDKPVFLFNATSLIDTSVEQYIQKGIDEGIHEKYLTSHRNPWYLLENRPPAPIWVSVFNRNGLKFIRNEANIRNLTTFHCIYLDMFSAPKTDLLFAYLLTDVSKEIFEDNRREYGNGLQKFEPNDINKAKMLDLNRIDNTSVDKIYELFKQYRQTDLDKKPDKAILTEINKIFVEYFS